jgi:hypothetical protein
MIKHFNTIYIGTLGILHQMNRGKMEIFIGSGIILMKGIVGVKLTFVVGYK